MGMLLRRYRKHKTKEGTEDVSVQYLKEQAKEKGIKGHTKMTKEELIEALKR